ncbi:MAG: hypothetical protein H7Y01_15325 [Ferruginibacter sp.]|nr:hypothetical protein [Chitinophagaceae bacterium]
MRKKVSLPDVLFFLLLLLVSCTYSTLAQNIPNAVVPYNMPAGAAYNAASSQNVGFKPFVAPGGISMGFVPGITQDAKGYMWFGATGLYRYDGYHLTAYKNDPLNPQSLGSNIIESICADKSGVIWVGTKGYGLDRFDPATGIFTHFRHNPQDPSSLIHNKVTVLFQDREGFLWIGTHGGLDRMDIKTGKFYHYQHSNDPNSLSCDQVRSIYEDREGTIWIGTGSPFSNDDSGPDEGGLNRFDKKTGKFIRYMNDPHDPNTLINNKVGAIFEDSRGNFWVGTAGDGLHTMDRGKGIFERQLYDPAHPEILSRPPLLTSSSFDQIRFITEDAAGYIWIGTVLSGLNRYDPNTGKTTYVGKIKTSSGYREITGWCSFTSHEGVLWVGSWQEDLYYMDPLQKNIPFISTGYTVRAFCEEDKNVLWMGTSEGLIRYDRKTGITNHFFSDYANDNFYVAKIYKDYNGTIWIGAYNRFYRYNAKTNDFALFQPGEKRISSFGGGNIFVITGDRKGSLLIGSDNGLDFMDRKTNVFTHYSMNSEDTNSLSQNWVTAAHEDLWGNLWIGTYNGGGINLFNPQTGKFKHYLKGTSITFLVEDSDSILWVGTDGGFYRYNRSDDAFNLFADPKGIIKTGSIYVNSIVEDDKRNLWMSTSLGILRLDSKRNDIRIYGKNRGVDAVNLISFSGYKGLNGALHFSAVSGYYSFFPDSLSGNSRPPQVVLTDFNLGNESINSGANNFLKEPLNEAKEIVLDHTHNIFSFDFAGIHYTSPSDNRHLFMLENYDIAWRQAGSEHTAYYHKVPPGRYIFRVKAASSEGEWAEKTIAIIINPPWWLTWWAYILYAILVMSLIYAVHRFQKQGVIQAERERTRLREFAQAKEIEKAYHELKTTQAQLIQSEKMASLGELTAGIAHEIQNPLNFVNNFSEVNKELIGEMKDEIEKGNYNDVKAIAKDIEENEEKINHHGKRADAIVKGMLQHSRSSSGVKELTDINKLADEYLRLAFHGLRAKDKSFNAELITDYDETIGKINIVPQDIGRAVLNLITNAFYVVAEKKKQLSERYEPTVTVTTKKVGDKVFVFVKDNGKGIPQKVLEKIFQPFFTTKPTGQGTGLGLSLAYDIIKAHGGELKVETKEGEGSEFIIQLAVV